MAQGVRHLNERANGNGPEVGRIVGFAASNTQPRTAETRPAERHQISFDGWAGCLADVAPEMSDAEFARFMLDERVRKAIESKP